METVSWRKVLLDSRWLVVVVVVVVDVDVTRVSLANVRSRLYVIVGCAAQLSCSECVNTMSRGCHSWLLNSCLSI